MDNSPDVQDVVSQLVDQLKTTAIHLDKKQKEVAKEKPSTDDVEKILIENSSKLIKGTLETIEELRVLVSTAPTAEDVEALAKLVAASAAAIESLNKVYTTNRKVQAAKELKQMDIEGKKTLQATEIEGKVKFNREELLKQILNDAKVIDAQVVTVKSE